MSSIIWPPATIVHLSSFERVPESSIFGIVGVIDVKSQQAALFFQEKQKSRRRRLRHQSTPTPSYDHIVIILQLSSLALAINHSKPCLHHQLVASSSAQPMELVERLH
jgi:hypothetical protein